MAYLAVGSSTGTASLAYQGGWDASTNTPTLTSSVGTNGFFYIVTIAGSTNLNGISSWGIGDWAVFNGGVWTKIDNQTAPVISVNTKTGAVVLSASDITTGTVPSSTVTGSYTGITDVGTLNSLSVANTINAKNIDLSGLTGEIKFAGNTILENDGASIYMSPSNDTSGTLNFSTGGSIRLDITAAGVVRPKAGLTVTGNTSLQTVTAGTWNGTAIGVQYGGSGANLSATSGYLKQATAGASFSNVSTIPAADVSGLAAVATSGSASDLTTGTLPSGRVSGSYSGITDVGTLSSLAVTNGITAGTNISATGNLAGANYTHYGVDISQINKTKFTKRFYYLADMFGTPTIAPIYTATNTGTITQQFVVTSFVTGQASCGSWLCSTTTGATNLAAATVGFQGFPAADFGSVRWRVDILIPTLSTGSERFLTFAGMSQSSGRALLSVQYRDDLNSGKFFVNTSLVGATVSQDTGVTVTAGKVYAIEGYYYNITPGDPGSASYSITITNVTDSGSPVTVTGSCFGPKVLSASKDSGLLSAGLVKSVGTTARTMSICHFEVAGSPLWS